MLAKLGYTKEYTKCPKCDCKFHYVNRNYRVNSEGYLFQINACINKEAHGKNCYIFEIKTNFKLKEFPNLISKSIDTPLYHYCEHCNKTYFNLYINSSYNYVKNILTITSCCPQCKERYKITKEIEELKDLKPSQRYKLIITA